MQPQHQDSVNFLAKICPLWFQTAHSEHRCVACWPVSSSCQRSDDRSFPCLISRSKGISSLCVYVHSYLSCSTLLIATCCQCLHLLRLTFLARILPMDASSLAHCHGRIAFLVWHHVSEPCRHGHCNVICE